MLLGEKESRQICDKLLSYVKADDAIVSVTNDVYSQQRFAANAFTTNGRSEDTTVSITVWIGKKRGAASTNEMDDASLKATVEEAEHLARISPVDREYLPTLSRQKYTPTNGFAESTISIPVVERARQIGAAITACEKAGVIGAGFHQARATANAIATKNGNFDYEQTTFISLGITARTPDGGSSGYFTRSHFDVNRLDTARIAHEAIRRSLEARNSRTIEPGRYRVILESQAVADLLGSAFNLFNARTADEGRSPFSMPGGKTRLGELVFDERINIYSDPWHPDLPGLHSAQDGLPAQKIHLIRNGKLENLIYSRFWAQQQGKEATPGAVNFILTSTAPPASVEEMIRNTSRGLLVSRFFYLRPTDPRTASLTGLTRDGVWHIENGKIQFPVRNFRFNQSIIQMLAPGNVEMIGASERVGSSEGQGRNALLLPALKLKAFNFTSQSEAV